MAHVIFTTPGLIDLRAIRTFGMSAKVKDNPLGFFGTGAKYSISIALREGCEITLWRGLDRYAFRTAPVDSRGKGFDVVVMDGPEGTTEMPFTLDLGKHWKIWQGYRELHSNTLDEDGTITVGYPAPREGYTTIAVKGEPMVNAYHNRHTIFLDSTPLYEDENLAVHLGGSPYVYYRGVRVYDLTKPTLYTYNLKQTLYGITEDRTLKNGDSDLGWYLAKFLEKCDDAGFLQDLMLAPQTAFEHGMYAYGSAATGTFLNTYAKLRQEGYAAQLTNWANALYLKLKKTYPLPPAITLTRIQRRQLDKAVAFCKAAGWDVDSYPIVVVPQAHGGLLALAEDGKIVLTEKLFDMGVKAIVSAALEEWCHLRFSYKDETRELQTFLFDRLVSAKEEVLNEAL